MHGFLTPETAVSEIIQKWMFPNLRMLVVTASEPNIYAKTWECYCILSSTNNMQKLKELTVTAFYLEADEVLSIVENFHRVHKITCCMEDSEFMQLHTFMSTTKIKIIRHVVPQFWIHVCILQHPIWKKSRVAIDIWYLVICITWIWKCRSTIKLVHQVIKCMTWFIPKIIMINLRIALRGSHKPTVVNQFILYLVSFRKWNIKSHCIQPVPMYLSSWFAQFVSCGIDSNIFELTLFWDDE